MNNVLTHTTFQRPTINFPELFFGIVSPVGTDVHRPITQLITALERKNYNVFHIKISKIIKQLAEVIGYTELKENDKYDRIQTYINCGNFLRSKFGNDILAAMAVSEICQLRLSRSIEFERNAYIIDQLKSEEELNLLRDIYGTLFFQISIYSARDIRVDTLSRIIAHSRLASDLNKFRDHAERLVVRDEDESELPNGQKVGKIFQFADIVLNSDKTNETFNIRKQIERFVELLFGSNRFSPNRHEYGMFLAFSAALRSLDLSRQVGAAIFRPTGEIACLGSNEVPKAGGGTYWADDLFDAREYTLENDSNETRKHQLLIEIRNIICGDDTVVSPETEKKLQKSQFMDALEYGRIVHAEMSAIMDAARLGIPIAGGTLYCTTFPCHMCSKHIVASGISNVVFLEPYPKSLTSDLHSDAVKIEGTSRGIYEQHPCVNYIPFFGITHRRYRDLFSRAKRKRDGKFMNYADDVPKPVISMFAPWYAERENEIITIVKNNIQSFSKAAQPGSGRRTGRGGRRRRS